MDRSVLPRTIPGIHSISLVNVDHDDIKAIYHPLKNQLMTPYDYRSRANINIIERRFLNKDQQPQQETSKYRHNVIILSTNNAMFTRRYLYFCDMNTGKIKKFSILL